MYDVLVIGAGPGGLSAAIYAARAGKKVGIFEKELPGGQMTQTEKIENYPGVEDYLGMKISSNMERQAKEFGVEFFLEEVIALKLEGKEKEVKTSSKSYFSKTIILAMGSTPRKLGLAREDDFSGRGLGYCATCDGAFYAGLPVYIVGGGDSAFDEGLYLSNMVDHVYIMYRKETPRAANSLIKRVEEKDNMTIMLNTIVTSLDGDMLLNKMTIKNTKTGQEQVIEGNFGLFVFIGNDPNSEIIADQLELVGGYVSTNESMETSLPGVYAVGDLRDKKVRQVATAVGDGAIAGLSAGKYVDNL